MPVIGISRSQLLKGLGVDASIDELADSLGQLGCDVDELGQSSYYRCSRCSLLVERGSREEAPRRCEHCGHESEQAFALESTAETIKLDLLPARPDLFDAGGLTRALRGYMGLVRGLPEYRVGGIGLELEVDRSTASDDSYRPHIACALVTVDPLDGSALKDLMKFQETLHWGIGRDRKLASIGVYDMDTLEGPFRYTTVGPEELHFCPLGHPEEPQSPRQILETHSKGKMYAHLLKAFSRYPLLVDARGRVLSMPPIINSEETRVREGSTRLFVDVTGTTRDDVERTLNTLVSSMAELGARLEAVKITGAEGSRVTPDLTPRRLTIEVEEANRWIGLELSNEEAGELLEKMRLSWIDLGDGRLEVRYPAYRGDVKHQVDLFEDLAIGYGYRNLIPDTVKTQTFGMPRPEEVLKNQVREIMIGLGCHEVLSLLQTTVDEHFSRMGHEPKDFVEIANPKIRDLKVLRTHLLSGLLKTLEVNKGRPAPQRFFEVGTTFALDSTAETGVREEIRVAFAVAGAGGYAPARGLIDALLWELGRGGDFEADKDQSFVAGRLACIRSGGEVVGRVGEIHPRVLNAFNIRHNVGVGELLLRVMVFD